MEEYLTVDREAMAEFEVKKSRFLCYAKPTVTEEEASAFIEKVRSKHWDARHGVPVYILEGGRVQRYSDDGEPQGTAGVPALDVLKKEGVTDCTVVIIRYFGGVLLGTGGLVRAYSHGASLALQAAEIVRMVPYSLLSFSCSYSFYGKVPAILAEYEGITVDTEFGSDVKLSVSVPSEKADTFIASMINSSSGTVVPKVTGEEYRKCRI